jgi:outer membrane putative beta-barrel porin/alpha-amylase
LRVSGFVAAFLLLRVGTAIAQPAQTPSQTTDLPANNDVNDATDNTDVGLLQIELGGQFTSTSSGSWTAGTPFGIRYGAFEWLEVSLGADGYLDQTDPSAPHATGFGNLQLGAKIRLFAALGGPPIVALLPQVNVPTADAPSGLGTGDWDFGLGVLTGKDFGRRGHVDISYSGAAIGEGDGLGRFYQQTAAIGGSFGLSPAWTPIVTLAWVSRQDADTGEAWTLTGESVLTASRRVAFDVSAQFGLNHEAPDFELAGGVSFVVGELDLDEGVHARRHHLRLHSRPRPSTRPH